MMSQYQNPPNRNPPTGPADSDQLVTAHAKIFKPAPNIMQRGKACSKKWVLEFEPLERSEIEPLMGWLSSGDMLTQIRLSFDTWEDAVAYCENHSIGYTVIPPKPAKIPKRTYAENYIPFEDGTPKDIYPH